MASVERTAYPRFKSNPSAPEIARLYTPTLRETDLASRTTRGEDQPLAFLVMLKGFQRLGYFPKSAQVPEAIVSHVRSWLGLRSDASAVPPPRSRQRYRNAIREHLGVESYGDEARRTAAEAVAEAALTMDDSADLINVAIEELVKERFELPAFSTLDRLARKVRYAVNSALFAGVDEGCCWQPGAAPRRCFLPPSPSSRTAAATTCRSCGAPTKARGRRSSAWPAPSFSTRPPRTAPWWRP